MTLSHCLVVANSQIIHGRNASTLISPARNQSMRCLIAQTINSGAVCQPAAPCFLICAIRIRPSRERTERFAAPVLPQLEGCDYFAPAQ
jgi:hypothetical protein